MIVDTLSIYEEENFGHQSSFLVLNSARAVNFHGVSKLCNCTKKVLLLLGTSTIGGKLLILISQCCKIWKPEVAHCYLPRVTDLKTQ